jgi:hypothetical protein
MQRQRLCLPATDRGNWVYSFPELGTNRSPLLAFDTPLRGEDNSEPVTCPVIHDNYGMDILGTADQGQGRLRVL